MVYVDDLLLGEDDKIKEFLKRLEGQLQLKHVTQLERGQPFVFLGRQIEHCNDHIAIALSMTNSLLSQHQGENTNSKQLVYYRSKTTSYHYWSDVCVIVT
eukprot:2467980-Amphidinium_carterae.1